MMLFTLSFKEKLLAVKNWITENSGAVFIFLWAVFLIPPFFVCVGGLAFIFWRDMPLPCIALLLACVWVISEYFLRHKKEKHINNLADSISYILSVASILHKTGQSLNIGTEGFLITVEKKGTNSELNDDTD